MGPKRLHLWIVLRPASQPCYPDQPERQAHKSAGSPRNFLNAEDETGVILSRVQAEAVHMLGSAGPSPYTCS